MFDFLLDAGNYESRKIGRDLVAGITVSTAYTSDESYETALIDSNGVHPVERYSGISEANLGHARWVLFAHTAEGKEVTELGLMDGLISDVKFTVSR